MGYYSFYRLLKEIRYLLRNKKIKKMLTVIIIIILIIFLLHNTGYCLENNSYEYTIELIPCNYNLIFDNNTYNLTVSTAQRYGYFFYMRTGFTYKITKSTSDWYIRCFTESVPSGGVPACSRENFTGTTEYITSNLNCFCYIYGEVPLIDKITITEISSNTTTDGTPWPGYDNHYVTVYDLYKSDNRIIESQNQIVSSIQELQQALNSFLYGDNSKEEYPVLSNTMNGYIINNSNQFVNSGNNDTCAVVFPVKNGYNYTFNYNYSFTNNNTPRLRAGFSTSISPNSTVAKDIDKPGNDSGTLTYNATQDGYYIFAFRGITSGNYNVTCVSNYNEAQELGLSQSIINNNNNNTQIIDNTLTDSNIDINDGQLVTDNTEDITEDGFDNIFEMIRTAFTGTPQSITFPIPFLDTNFTLQPNFLTNMLQSGGLGFMVTLVNAYWYFIISRFILKKIHFIIEGLKEGEFEQTTGNIKTEVF